MASHTIPMKRELKVGRIQIGTVPDIRFTHHPDEEGTERQLVGVW